MLKVSDIMSKNVLSVEATAAAREAATLFTARKISGAPVVHQGRVVGVLSKSDLVRADDLAVPISELMTPLAHRVRPDDSAQTAVDLLLDERLHRVLVTGPGGAILGVVTPADVLRAERGAALRYPSIWPHADSAHAVPEDGDF